MAIDILTANDRQGDYPASYYAATATPLPAFDGAKGALRADVCIVGAGFTGLSAALHLAQAGYDVALLDAHRVGFGASGRNGGQVGMGQRLGQDELEDMVGKDHARALWDLSLEAVALVRNLIDTHKMDCGWTPGIIGADHRARYVPHTHAYVDKLNTEYGYDQIRKLEREELRALVGSPAYHGGAMLSFAPITCCWPATVIWAVWTNRSPPGSCRSTTSSSRPNRWTKTLRAG